MNDNYTYSLIVVTWHDMAQKPEINLSAQYGVSVQGVAGLIEIYID